MRKPYIVTAILLSIFLLSFFVFSHLYWPIQLWTNWEYTIFDRLKFFLILIPAAIWDSINPCEFAVMFILLQSVLKAQQSKRKVVLVWLSFILAIFLSYLAIWLGLYKALASATNTNIVKLIAWVLWIIIWLANLKDYFWYWKYFKMEVPDSWRPNMKKFINKITSPIWAFFIWILISLFLLPCTSGPYITVLWYLSAESSTINNWWYIYLIIYNIIFIIPMFIILFLVISGSRDLGELKEIKELNVEKMHLITWVIMLLLWAYIFYDLYQVWFFNF